MEELGEAGWLQRLGMQFHWNNEGYATFEDFLGALASRKRKFCGASGVMQMRRGFRSAHCAAMKSSHGIGMRLPVLPQYGGS